MRRFYLLAVLMLLSSSAFAGNSISFVVVGHRIQIESSRYCRSTSCASVSISGIYQSRRDRDEYDDDDGGAVEPVRSVPPAPATVSSIPAAAPAINAPVRPVVAAPPPVVYKPAASATRIVAAPPLLIQPAVTAPQGPRPAAPSIAKPAEAVRPAPVAVPQISRVSQHVEDEPADMPVGDWQTESKGTVRIAKCGNALCGYVLNPSVQRQGRGGADQHEAEDRPAMDRQRLQP
jgi:hypothetical protein